MRVVLLLCLILSTCDHPAPPMPEGRLIPINPASLAADYRGNELYPGLARPAP